MVQIDGQAAVDLLRAAVAENGADFVYEQDTSSLPGPLCLYVNKDLTPSCIVGNALIRAGADPQVLKDADESVGTYHDPFYDEDVRVSDTGIGSPDFNLYLSEHGIKLTGEARVIFERAQHLQDNGRPWGEALREAEAELDYVTERTV